jgi:hypothetical protein
VDDNVHSGGVDLNRLVERIVRADRVDEVALQALRDQD